MKVRIIPPQERHISQLQELSQAFAQEQEWSARIPIGQISDPETARDKLFGQDATAVRVAEHPEGQLIGFAGVYKYSQDNYGLSILIDRQFRQAGVGRQLVNAVFALLPPGLNVDAWVVQENKVSMAATPQLGFSFHSNLEDKIDDGPPLQICVFRRQT